MKICHVTRVVVFFGIVCVAATAMAQNDSQKFTVVVPSNLSITAPADMSITHDETDADQAFATQQWVVKGNELNGVSVSFATDQAFKHSTEPTYKRDVKLDLSVASSLGPASWTLGQSTDTTDYVGSDEIATVAASSNGVGRATFDLAVTFITDSFGTFAAGSYETTVTGTVTSN